MTYPRTANNEKELTVSRGEYLEVESNTRTSLSTKEIKSSGNIKTVHRRTRFDPTIKAQYRYVLVKLKMCKEF